MLTGASSGYGYSGQVQTTYQQLQSSSASPVALAIASAVNASQQINQDSLI
jgi:hypothetical protein